MSISKSNLNILNDLTHGLYMIYENKKNHVCNYNQNLIIEADELFNKLIEEIHIRRVSIPKYVKNPKHPSIYATVSNENFTFTYTIFKGLNSDLLLERKTFLNISLNDEFVKSKVQLLNGYVYFLNSQFGYKIGMTTDLRSRKKTFDVKLPFEVSNYAYFQCVNYRDWEIVIHKMFDDKRINGEWFDLSKEDFKKIEEELKKKKIELIYDKAIDHVNT